MSRSGLIPIKEWTWTSRLSAVEVQRRLVQNSAEFPGRVKLTGFRIQPRLGRPPRRLPVVIVARVTERVGGGSELKIRTRLSWLVIATGLALAYVPAFLMKLPKLGVILGGGMYVLLLVSFHLDSNRGRKRLGGLLAVTDPINHVGTAGRRVS